MLYTIAATGERPMKFTVENLPEGLQVDSQNGQMTGSVAERGTYRVTLRVENFLGEAERELRIEVGEIALKDVILPGEMRDILNQVVAAQKEAEAGVIRRREETNATRSLLNTARVMADNPVMLRLKELEALETIAGKVERLTVHNGTEGLLTDLVKLRD